MGHTHYWCQENGDIPADAWAKIMVDAKTLVDATAKSGIRLWHEYDEPGTQPHLANDQIIFNGAGDDGHETFALEQGPAEFTFCKTARKPYDRVVCAILAITKEYAPDHIEVSSDGDADDWRPHLEWAGAVLGRTVCLPFVGTPEPAT